MLSEVFAGVTGQTADAICIEGGAGDIAAPTVGVDLFDFGFVPGLETERTIVDHDAFRGDLEADPISGREGGKECRDVKPDWDLHSVSFLESIACDGGVR